MDAKDAYIRELEETDLDQMIQIRLDLLRKHPKNFGSSAEEEGQFTKEKWMSRLTNTKTRTIGVFEENQLIGLGVLALNPRKKMKHIGVLNSFYINEDYRKKGLAKKLLGYIEDLAKELGIVRINLSVMEENKQAIRFYEQSGFTKTGREIDTLFVEGNYYSLELMSKALETKEKK